MTRLIYADALEKAIYEWMPKDQETWMESDIPPVEDLVVSIMMTIEEQPTVDAVPHWIPVSDKPKKDGRYQVTRHDYVTNTEFIDILWYEENLWWNRHSTGNYAVTAWMPLPEPYEGDKE